MELLIQYAMSFLGTRYQFGGDSPPDGGLDCSGLVCEILRFPGLVGNKQDLTAQGLYDLFEKAGQHNTFGAGNLAFYGKSVTKITHVAFMISPYTIIEAGGGDSTTTTQQAAAQANAFVRCRPVKYRGDLVATIKLPYRSIGLL